MLIEPSDPIAAVTHLDPYPFYERLSIERPIYRDEALGVWVAASAEAVHSVLTNPRCHVRPADEPVPAAIVGTAAGRIFGLLARFTDGESHERTKRAVSAALATIDESRVIELAHHWAKRLIDERSTSSA